MGTEGMTLLLPLFREAAGELVDQLPNILVLHSFT